MNNSRRVRKSNEVNSTWAHAMEGMEIFALVAWPVVLGMAAVGLVLFIKITRRRQATRDPRYTDAVPAHPMSAAHAQRLLHRYLWAVAAVLLALVLLAIPMLAR